ncbi:MULTISPECIES: hypothetical protein [unclassified Rathayibacter]|nr:MULTISPECIES: hypothetical protein [unclassified Rathayibacter]
MQSELRRRGRLDPEPVGATFRERMLGAGLHLAPEHHVESFRPAATE